jgi:hypothetical protein
MRSEFFLFAGGSSPTGSAQLDVPRTTGADLPRLKKIRFGNLHLGDWVEFAQKQVEVHSASLMVGSVGTEFVERTSAVGSSARRSWALARLSREAIAFTEQPNTDAASA